MLYIYILLGLAGLTYIAFRIYKSYSAAWYLFRNYKVAKGSTLKDPERLYKTFVYVMAYVTAPGVIEWSANNKNIQIRKHTALQFIHGFGDDFKLESYYLFLLRDETLKNLNGSVSKEMFESFCSTLSLYQKRYAAYILYSIAYASPSPFSQKQVAPYCRQIVSHIGLSAQECNDLETAVKAGNGYAWYASYVAGNDIYTASTDKQPLIYRMDGLTLKEEKTNLVFNNIEPVRYRMWFLVALIFFPYVFAVAAGLPDSWPAPPQLLNKIFFALFCIYCLYLFFCDYKWQNLHLVATCSDVKKCIVCSLLSWLMVLSSLGFFVYVSNYMIISSFGETYPKTYTITYQCRQPQIENVIEERQCELYELPPAEVRKDFLDDYFESNWLKVHTIKKLKTQYQTDAPNFILAVSTLLGAESFKEPSSRYLLFNTKLYEQVYNPKDSTITVKYNCAYDGSVIDSSFVYIYK